MKKGGWLLLMTATAGWLVGHAAHRVSAPASDGHLPGTATAPAAGSREIIPPFHAPAWSVRGRMGLEELRTLPAGALRTAETALWLAGADAAGIAAWWDGLAAEDPQDPALLDLVMTRWMELDPQGALAAVGGTAEEFRAWYAWGIVDAEAAVKEAMARESGYLFWVSRGAGASNPRLAMKLMNQYPAMKFPGVEHSIMEGLKNESWQDALDYVFEVSTLRSWARHQPKQAFEWALANLRKVEASHENGSALWQTLMADLDESYVKGVIEGMPPGKTRETLETAMLKQLIDRDVEAAVQLAKETGNASEKNMMLAEVGKSLASRDPGRSLQLFREVLESGGSKPQVHVIYPEGGSSTQPHPAFLYPWMDRLMAQDPAGVMETARSSAPHGDLVRNIASMWMARDLESFGRWAEALPDGSDSDPYFSAFASKLMNDAATRNPADSFAESLEWAARVSNETLRKDQNWTIIQHWIQKHPDSAGEYFSAEGGATQEQQAVYQTVKGLTQ